MGNALRDQLLKAGLVNSKQVKKAVKEKQKETIISKEQKKPDENSMLREQAKHAQLEKAERDRQLNLQRKQAAEAKALEAQIKQLLDGHQIPLPKDAEIVFNFNDGGKVKRIYVTEGLRKALSNGQMAIASSSGDYVIVSAEIAAKIVERDPASIVLWNKLETDSAQKNANDPYADYEVPDDLIW